MPTNEERREVAARLRSVTDEEFRMCFLEEILAGCVGYTHVYDSECQLDNRLMINRLADLIEPEPESDKREPIRCPNCGASVYAVNYLTSTLIGWTPRYVDGVQVNKDPNKTTKHCTCLLCGSDFEYEVD